LYFEYRVANSVNIEEQIVKQAAKSISQGVGVRVIIGDKTGYAYLGATDAQGFFIIIAQLGDESAGEPLTLAFGQAVARLRATFDPANHRDDRGTRIDLEGATFVERSALFRATLLDAVGAAQH